jgi:exopolysaccharide biosynthesis protein
VRTGFVKTFTEQNAKTYVNTFINRLIFQGGNAMKKTALVTAVIMLCTLLVPAKSLSAGQEIIHREETVNQIARNVVYKTITQFTDQGWDKIHVLEADISNPRTQLGILTPPGGLGTGSTLPEMVEDSKTVAAINGDFFISGESFSPIGPLVRDGELQSSPTYRMDELAVFSIDKRDVPIIEHWNWETRLLVGDLDLPVAAINKISDDYAYPMVYTQQWGATAPKAAFEDILYVTVEKNRVIDIMKGPVEEVYIPDGGMVIMARGDAALSLLQVLKPRTLIELETVSTPDYESMSLAIGGGSVLVRNGSVPPFTHNIEGNHPRTALGFSRDGKRIIAVAVEGRTQGAKGMTQTQLARLMIDLGAYQAINLDGGGSTTMLARKPGDETLTLANTPSDGSIRRISNGISINSTAPRGSLRHILLEVEDTKVFTGTGRTITVKGCDSNFNPVPVDPLRVKWSVSGVEGSFTGNVFYPATTGSATITASYMGRTAEMDLKVLDAPVSLSVPQSIKTDVDRSVAFNVYGKNALGYSALIENRDLVIETTIGSIGGQNFLSGSREGTGEIRIGNNGLQYKVPVSVGYQRVIIDNFEVSNGSFASYPDTVTGHYALDINNPYGGRTSGRLAYDFTSTNVTAASYLVFNENGITLDSLPERLGVFAYSPEKSSHWLRMIVEDSNGTSVTLDLTRKMDWTGYKFLDAQVPQNLAAPIFVKRIYVVETNPIMNDAGQIYIDDLTALYPHSLQLADSGSQAVVPDPQRVHEAPNNYDFSFALFGNTSIKKLIDIHVVKRMKKHATEFGGMAVFAGSIGDDTLSGLDLPVISTKGGYSVTRQGNNTFLQLDNHPGGLRAYSPQQWHWLKQQLGGIKDGNLFVVLPQPVWDRKGFADILEAELLHDYLSDLYEEKGVDVYVLTGGRAAFHYDIRDGIRYIGINGTAASSANSSDLENYRFVRFYISGDGTVTYQVIPLF